MKQKKNKKTEDNRDIRNKNTTLSTAQLKKEVDKVMHVTEENPFTGQKQYPKKLGHHGTDNERELNPEE